MITVTIRVLVFVKALSRSAIVAAIATEAASILGVLAVWPVCNRAIAVICADQSVVNR